MEHLQEGIHELDEHHNFKEKFLGKEGMFSAYRVTVGYFYRFENECGGKGFNDTAGEELKKRGFQYDLYEDPKTFLETILEYDIAWIISNATTLLNEGEYVAKIGEFMRLKKSLFLWADNTPYTTWVNPILMKYFNGMYLQGSYWGGKIITKGEVAENGKFCQNHAFAYGLNNLHEGITIPSPVKLDPQFKVFAYNSQNEPLIMYADENENHGRIIVDTAFTKLYTTYWTTAGTHQYVSNANVWLTGIPA